MSYIQWLHSALCFNEWVCLENNFLGKVIASNLSEINICLILVSLSPCF